MDPNVFYDKYIDKDFEESYIPHRFEEICTQYLIRQNRLGTQLQKATADVEFNRLLIYN